MNAYTFTQNLKNEFGPNLNVITKSGNGYSLEVFDGKMIKSDLTGKSRKYYKSVESLQKFSKLYAKHFNNQTIVVESLSTDYAKATITKL